MRTSISLRNAAPQTIYCLAMVLFVAAAVAGLVRSVGSVTVILIGAVTLALARTRLMAATVVMATVFASSMTWLPVPLLARIYLQLVQASWILLVGVTVMHAAHSGIYRTRGLVFPNCLGGPFLATALGAGIISWFEPLATPWFILAYGLVIMNEHDYWEARPMTVARRLLIKVLFPAAVIAWVVGKMPWVGQAALGLTGVIGAVIFVYDLPYLYFRGDKGVDEMMREQRLRIIS